MIQFIPLPSCGWTSKLLSSTVGALSSGNESQSGGVNGGVRVDAEEEAEFALMDIWFSRRVHFNKFPPLSVVEEKTRRMSRSKTLNVSRTMSLRSSAFVDIVIGIVLKYRTISFPSRVYWTFTPKKLVHPLVATSNLAQTYRSFISFFNSSRRAAAFSLTTTFIFSALIASHLRHLAIGLRSFWIEGSSNRSKGRPFTVQIFTTRFSNSSWDIRNETLLSWKLFLRSLATFPCKIQNLSNFSLCCLQRWRFKLETLDVCKKRKKMNICNSWKKCPFFSHAEPVL